MNAQDLSNEILNEIELDRVKKFAGDELMFQAVKKYVLAIAYHHGVIKEGEPHQGNLNYALNMAWGAINTQGGMPRSDEELGQNLRSLAHAVQLVEGGFKEIAEMKEVEQLEKKEEEVNEAE